MSKSSSILWFRDWIVNSRAPLACAFQTRNNTWRTNGKNVCSSLLHASEMMMNLVSMADLSIEQLPEWKWKRSTSAANGRWYDTPWAKTWRIRQRPDLILLLHSWCYFPTFWSYDPKASWYYRAALALLPFMIACFLILCITLLILFCLPDLCVWYHFQVTRLIFFSLWPYWSGVLASQSCFTFLSTFWASFLVSSWLCFSTRCPRILVWSLGFLSKCLGVRIWFCVPDLFFPQWMSKYANICPSFLILCCSL